MPPTFLMLCTVCKEEISFFTGRDTDNAVCKKCTNVSTRKKSTKITYGDDVLQKVQKASLDYKPIGVVDMERLKLHCNFARDKVVVFDDVAVHFDTNGDGTTASHNRSKIEKFMKQRPNRVTIVEDTPEEVVEPVRTYTIPEVVKVVEPVVEDTKPVEPVVEDTKPEEVKVEAAPVEEVKVAKAPVAAPKTTKKKGRKSNKTNKDTEK